MLSTLTRAVNVELMTRSRPALQIRMKTFRR